MSRLHNTKSCADALRKMLPVKLTGVFEDDIDIEGEVFDDLLARADDLYNAVFPSNMDPLDASTIELLDTFEEELGIVWAVSPVPAADRINLIWASLYIQPNLSILFFRWYIGLYGITIVQIEELIPLQCGISRCGDYLMANTFAWKIWLVASVAGEHDFLLPLLDALKPAHTTVTIEYVI